MKYEEVKRTIIEHLIDSWHYLENKDESFIFDPRDVALMDTRPDATQKILYQLQDIGVIKVRVADPIMIDFDEARGIPIYDDNESYKVKINNLDALKENVSKTPSLNLRSRPNEDTTFFIIYNDNDRRILLNGKIELSKPNFNSENDIVFNFLYKNPNKTYTKLMLLEEAKHRVSKPFSKIVENLGFTRGLKDAFFNVSKDSIRFNNPAIFPK